MGDRALVHAIEMATLNSVPTPWQRFDGSFLIRAFHGGTGRGNAASSLYPAADPDLQGRLERISAIYQGLGLTPRIRSTPLDPPGTADLLVAAGWRAADETVVLSGALQPMAASEAMPEVFDGPVETWLSVVATAEYQGSARQREKLEGATLMTIPCAWMVLEDAASIFVSADGPLCGIFDLAVRPEARRQGLARRIIGAAAAWGQRRGCDTIWAQVSATNSASMTLNASLGMRESHRYRYFLRL